MTLGADNSHHNRVARNIIRNNAHEGIYFGKQSDNNLIEANHVHHCLKNGIDVNGSWNRILNNVVHDIGVSGDSVDTVGIMAGYLPSSPSTDNLISGNTVMRCATHGIQLWAVSERNIITHNVIEENSSYGIFLERLGEGRCENNIVSHNVSRKNADYGIVLQSASYNVVSGNQCIQNGSDGIALFASNGESTGNSLLGNVSRLNARHGIHIGSGVAETQLAGNVESGNGAGADK